MEKSLKTKPGEVARKGEGEGGGGGGHLPPPRKSRDPF